MERPNLRRRKAAKDAANAPAKARAKAPAKKAAARPKRQAKRAAKKPGRLQKLAFRRGGGKPRTGKPKPKAAAKKKAAARKKKDTTGLWFRASTRVRAGGYWVREKAQAAGRGGRALAGRAGDFWASRSRRGKIQIGAVSGVLLLYAILKFIPVPGVPCGFSAAKECAPVDDTVALAPADSLLYAHVTLDSDTAQAERAGRRFEQLTELERVVVGGVATAIPAPSGVAIDLRRDVLPWADHDLAATLVPPTRPSGAPEEAFVAGVGDRAGAEAFIAKIAPAGSEPQAKKSGEGSYDLYDDGFATAFVDDQLAFGSEAAVRAVVNVSTGAAPSLDGADGAAARDDLSDGRFADIYLSRAGVQQLLDGRAGPASQLETFVEYGATEGLAAGLIAQDDGLEVELVSDLDPKLTAKSPSFFSELPDFQPDLASDAGDRAIGLIGVGRLGPTLAGLLEESGPDAGGLAGSLQALAKRLQEEAGVDPLQDLLPALGGQAALIAEPTDGSPVASLVVDGVDEDQAAKALASLQEPILKSIGRGGGAAGAVPQFSEKDVDGVTVRSVQLSPAVNLSYALFDGKLVVSTSPDGVAQVRDGGDGLAGTDGYKTATDRLPETVSALVFLNLDELFGQVTDLGLAEDPNFADLTVLFENATSLGLAVNGDDDQIRTELFLAVD